MHRALVFFFALFVTQAAACAQTNSSQKAAPDTLRALDIQLQNAITDGDLERIMSFYAEDAVLLPAAEPLIEGKEAIRDEWAHILTIPGFQNTSALAKLDISASGDLAYIVGSYKAVMMGEDGGTVQEPGKWVTIWKRQPTGGWRIVVDMYNTDVPPPDHK